MDIKAESWSPAFTTLETIDPGIHEAFLMTEQSDYFRDYFRFCLRRCFEAIKSYENAANMIQDTEIKSFFENMALLKKNEFRQLREIDFQEICFSDLNNTSPVDAMTMYMLDAGLCPVDTLEEACDFALRNEYANLQMYLRLSDLENESRTKRLFLFLVEQEKSHLQQIQNRQILARAEPEKTRTMIFDW
ncbi:MAG: hypothetical protein MUF22_01065 [Chitinispirillaceae bacterium]|nr:hypothetical protein [Chitinispirillaceae bacterium]